jgi:hypothetical protein
MKRFIAALMVISCLSVTGLSLAQNNKPAFSGLGAYVPAPTFTPTPVPVPTPLFNKPLNSSIPIIQYQRKVRRHHKSVVKSTPTPTNSGISSGAGTANSH